MNGKTWKLLDSEGSSVGEDGGAVKRVFGWISSGFSKSQVGSGEFVHFWPSGTSNPAKFSYKNINMASSEISMPYDESLAVLMHCSFVSPKNAKWKGCGCCQTVPVKYMHGERFLRNRSFRLKSPDFLALISAV